MLQHIQISSGLFFGTSTAVVATPDFQSLSRVMVLAAVVYIGYLGVVIVFHIKKLM